MYTLSHFQQLGLKEVPTDASVTSLPQQWHKPRGRKIQPESVTDLVLAKPTKTIRKRKPVFHQEQATAHRYCCKNSWNQYKYSSKSLLIKFIGNEKMLPFLFKCSHLHKDMLNCWKSIQIHLKSIPNKVYRIKLLVETYKSVFADILVSQVHLLTQVMFYRNCTTASITHKWIKLMQWAAFPIAISTGWIEEKIVHFFHSIVQPTKSEIRRLKVPGTALSYLLTEDSPEADTPLGKVQRGSSLFYQAIMIRQL